jgi:hypothetical protein
MLLEIMFNNIISTTRETIEKAKEEKSPNFDMTNMISIIDVSGSMRGIPISVAIALGIITGELVNDNFKKKGITFSKEPRFIDWNRCYTLEEIIKLIKQSNWDMDTNLEKTMDLIIQTVKEHHLTRDQIPNLLVLSDMQFNCAINSQYWDRSRSHYRINWNTMHENIVRKFKDLGMELEGVEWEPPLIFYWNLRGDTTGFPVKTDTEGTAMLSGFSPSLLQLVLTGDFPVEEINSDDSEPQLKIKLTPYQLFRKAIDNEFYDIIRRKLSIINQYPFEHYHID